MSGDSTLMTPPTKALTRPEVYARIDGELDYAHRKWDTTACDGRHSPLEWLVYMEHYIGIAKEAGSTVFDPIATQVVMENIRKIAGLAVTAMEQHGVKPRRDRGDGLNVWTQSGVEV